MAAELIASDAARLGDTDFAFAPHSKKAKSPACIASSEGETRIVILDAGSVAYARMRAAPRLGSEASRDSGSPWRITPPSGRRH